MLILRSRLAQAIVPAVLVLLVAAVACQPVEQQGLSRDEIRQVVRVEVNSQIEAAKQQMSQEFEPFKGDMEFQLMQPLNELRFEFDDLRNQVEFHIAADRESSGDPRRSISERYDSRDSYLQQVENAAQTLVDEGYLLAEDLPKVVDRAGLKYDYFMGETPAE